MASTIVKIPKTTPYTLAGSHCGDWIMVNAGAVEVMFAVAARLGFCGRLTAILASDSVVNYRRKNEERMCDFVFAVSSEYYRTGL
jgi:hypothetical protein